MGVSGIDRLLVAPKDYGLRWVSQPIEGVQQARHRKIPETYRSIQQPKPTGRGPCARPKPAVIVIEAGRGEISRSARSALDPAAQGYQDLMDQLFYRMAGLSAGEAAGLEDRLAKML